MNDANRRKATALALATAIAIPAEGLRQLAYYDPAGILTVCYGTTSNVDAKRRYSVEECLALLDGDMRVAVDRVERCVPGLPPEMLAAWADAVYNLGPKIVCDLKASTAARLLSARKLVDACLQLPRWDKAKVLGFTVSLPGLTKRRVKEMDLCLGGAA